MKPKPPAGYNEVCSKCVFRDYYDLAKAAKDQTTLINNLRIQLIAVTKQMEDLKAKKEEDNTD